MKFFIIWSDWDSGCQIEEFDNREAAEKRATEIQRLEDLEKNGTTLKAVINGLKVTIEKVEVATEIKFIND